MRTNLNKVYMPLLTDNKEPYLSYREFSSYKVMQKLGDSYIVCPPNDEWNEKRYELGIMYETDSNSNSSISGEIGAGYIHTFIDLMDAVEYLNFMKSTYPNRQFVILEAVIPKDAKYYVGRYTRYPGMFTYASDKVKYIKVI